MNPTDLDKKYRVLFNPINMKYAQDISIILANCGGNMDVLDQIVERVYAATINPKDNPEEHRGQIL